MRASVVFGTRLWAPVKPADECASVWRLSWRAQGGGGPQEGWALPPAPPLHCWFHDLEGSQGANSQDPS